MEVLKLIERIEKNKQVGRFDKKSSLVFINDALFEISKRQGLFVTEEIENFTESPISLKGIVIKLQGVKFSSGDFRIQIYPNGVIHVLKRKDEDGFKWEYVKESHGINVNVSVTYTGYIPVRNFEGEDSEITVPEYLQTSIVYYVLSKMFEESGNYEQSRYFADQYNREFLVKPSPRREVVSKPSEYSLL